MLVKELRQGLRTRSFVGVFLTLQILLGIILLAAGASASSDNAGTTISNIIFLFFSVAVLIIQPMRGISALSSEIKDNTIDMLVLTRLSAWRVVTGKWSSIVSQSALILVTIIPYLILRYFFGGMNLIGEMMLLLLIFVTSATITAITVGLSASGSVILRSVLPMLALPAGAIAMIGMIFDAGNSNLAEFCSLNTDNSRIFVSLYLAASVYIGFFFLSTGTSLIAPYAENHSTLRRLIALGVTIVAAVLGSMTFTDPEILPFLFAFILAPAFAISLSEFTDLVPPVYQKFSRYGFFGKVVSLFLLPGWATGLFFCLLLTIISAIPFVLNSPLYSTKDYFLYGLIALGTLLFPSFIINVLRMKGPQRVSNYVLLGAASCIAAMVLAGIAESMSHKAFLWLFVWIPPVLLFMQESSSFIDSDIFVTVIIVDLALIISLLLLALTAYRSTMRDLKASIESVE